MRHLLSFWLKHAKLLKNKDIYGNKAKLIMLFIKRYISLILFCLLLLGCQERTAILNSERIFRIPVGIMRKEINLFSRNNFLYNDNSSFTLTPLGNYFISDRSSRKIFHYTNYGKLSYIIYNPEYRYDSDRGNPKYLDTIYPFGEISEIAANMDKLYVTSTINKNIEEPNSLYTQAILTFDKKGKFLYWIGTEGIGKQYFRYRITKLFIDSQNNLFVILRGPEIYQIYQFSDDGTLLHNFQLSVSQTILQDKSFQNRSPKERNMFFEITAPNFSYDGKLLFFELYSYITKINDATSKTREIQSNKYDIYSIQTEPNSQKLKKHFTVRDFRSENAEIQQVYGEQLMGTTSNGFLVFLKTYSNGKNALVYRNKRGRLQYTVSIDIDPNIPYKLYLAPNGLVSALNFYEDEVIVTWWRTDKLLNKELSF